MDSSLAEQSGSRPLAGTVIRRTIQVLLVLAAMFLFSLLIVEREVWAGIDNDRHLHQPFEP